MQYLLLFGADRVGLAQAPPIYRQVGSVVSLMRGRQNEIEKDERRVRDAMKGANGG